MKLNEIFNQDYYDHIQDERKQKAETRRYEDIPDDAETSLADFIVSKYEVGKISYEEALKELKDKTPSDELFFWEHELAMARELKDD